MCANLPEELSIAVEAAVLECGYNIGFFSLRDVEHWAESQIAAVDRPTDALIDLAILRDTHPLDVMKLLKTVSGDLPASESIAMRIGFIGHCFEEGKISLLTGIRGLWPLVFEAGISSEQESQIYWLDDAYDLAVAGYYGTLADVDGGFRQFVMPYTQMLQQRCNSLLLGKH